MPPPHPIRVGAHHALCVSRGSWAPCGTRSGPDGAHLAPQQRAARPNKRSIFTPSAARMEGMDGGTDREMGLAWCFYKLCRRHSTALISMPDPSAQRSPSASQHDRDIKASAGFGGGDLQDVSASYPKAWGHAQPELSSRTGSPAALAPCAVRRWQLQCPCLPCPCQHGCGHHKVLCGLPDCPCSPEDGAESSWDSVPALSVPRRTPSPASHSVASGGKNP